MIHAPDVVNPAAFWERSLPDPSALPLLTIEDAQRQTGGGTYFLVNGDGEVEYVGQSASLGQRIAQHRRDPKKAHLTGVRVLWVADDQERLTWETIYIAILRPRLNSALLLRVAGGRLSEIRYPRKRGG